jgi:hypothetical protein
MGLWWRIVALVALVAGCGDEAAEQAPPLLEAGPAVCGGGPTRPEAVHVPLVKPLGPSPNAIKTRVGALWIVQSGDNTVGRYDLATGAWDADFIDVGNDQNPYDVEVAGDEVYVANFLGNTVTVADAVSGRVKRTLSHPTLKQPSAVAITQRRVYVGNVELQGPGRFGPGSVAVFDRATGDHLVTLPVAAPNPQYLSVIPSAAGERIVVVSTGGLRIVDGQAELTTEGAVEVWREQADPAQPLRTTLPVPLDPMQPRRGALGAPHPTPDGRYWYFASATSAELFKLDAVTLRWERGPDAPIRFAPEAPLSLHHAVMLADGALAISSFNEDALYLWDTTCDMLLAGPLALGESPSRLEGPHGLAVSRAGDGVHLWYITSLSNTLGKVMLSPKD